MATKRFHGKRWEYAVRRKQLLPKPLYLNFDSEAEGDVYRDAAEFVDACNCPQELSIAKSLPRSECSCASKVRTRPSTGMTAEGHQRIGAVSRGKNITPLLCLAA